MSPPRPGGMMPLNRSIITASVVFVLWYSFRLPVPSLPLRLFSRTLISMGSVRWCLVCFVGLLGLNVFCSGRFLYCNIRFLPTIFIHSYSLSFFTYLCFCACVCVCASMRNSSSPWGVEGAEAVVRSARILRVLPRPSRMVL